MPLSRYFLIRFLVQINKSLYLCLLTSNTIILCFQYNFEQEMKNKKPVMANSEKWNEARTARQTPKDKWQFTKPTKTQKPAQEEQVAIHETNKETCTRRARSGSSLGPQGHKNLHRKDIKKRTIGSLTSRTQSEQEKVKWQSNRSTRSNGQA